jgi:hypothetical protein
MCAWHPMRGCSPSGREQPIPPPPCTILLRILEESTIW